MNVLVIGGAGYIGSKLTRMLLERGRRRYCPRPAAFRQPVSRPSAR